MMMWRLQRSQLTEYTKSKFPMDCRIAFNHEACLDSCPRRNDGIVYENFFNSWNVNSD